MAITEIRRNKVKGDNIMRKKIAIIAFISALVLTGCGNVTQAAQVPEATTSVTTTAEPTTEATTVAEEYKLIGKKAEGSKRS